MDALTKVSAGLTSGLQFVQQKIDTVVEEHVAKGKRHTPPDADAPEGPALIRYRFVKDDEDDNVFVVPGHTAGTVTELTAGEVKSHFPLKGNYHFRYKMSPIDEGFEYIWVDVHDHDRVPTYHGNVYMKILPIPSNVAPLNIATSPRPSRNGGSQPVPHRQPSNVAVRQVSGSPAQQRPSQSPAPAPVAPTPPPAPVVMPNREELVKKREDETNARVQAKLEKHQNKVAQEEQMKAAKVEAHENLKDVLDKWAKTPEGQWKDVRTLLSTMQDVMWADSGWKPCPLSELMMSAPAVKKAYRRAIVITHPDRHQSASAEQHVRADRIFNALNESFKQS